MAKCPVCKGRRKIAKLDVMQGKTTKRKCTACFGTGEEIIATPDGIKISKVLGQALTFTYYDGKHMLCTFLILMRKFHKEPKKRILTIAPKEEAVVTYFPSQIHAVWAHENCPAEVIIQVLESIKTHQRMVFIKQDCPHIDRRCMQLLKDNGLRPLNDNFSWRNPDEAGFKES